MNVELKYANLLLHYLDTLYKKYKHVSIKIESYWGTELCHTYLRYLLIKENDREIERIGFDFAEFQIIMSLYIIHVKQFGNFGNPVLLDDINLNVESICYNNALIDQNL